MYIGVSKMTSKGQITIPAEIRESKKLKTGSDLLFIDLGDAVLIKRTEDLTDMFSSLGKKVRALGITRKDIEKEVKSEKSKTWRKYYA